METSGKISFMPKSSFSSGKDYYRKVGSGLLMKIAILLLIVSSLLSIGAVLYKRMISQQITDLSSSLDRAKSAFEPSLITQLEGISFSIPSASLLLEGHLYPTKIFKLIEDTTVGGVYFTNFSYSYSASAEKNKTKTVVVEKSGVNQNVIKVQLSGNAKSYEALAQQSDIYSKTKFIDDFSFSNFGLTDKGDVSFSLTIDVSNEINK